MQQNDLEQKNITIAGVKDVGWGISLEDEKGLKYNVSKMLKDGSAETKAFQVLKGLSGYGMGLQKCVKFATVPNQQGGQSRYVRIIGEPEADNQQATNTQYPPKTLSTCFVGAKTGYTAGRPDQSDEIRANVALKMVSEILAAGVVPITEWREWADTFYSYKPNIKQNTPAQEGLTPEQEGEINIGDGIPF